MRGRARWQCESAGVEEQGRLGRGQGCRREDRGAGGCREVCKAKLPWGPDLARSPPVIMGSHILLQKTSQATFSWHLFLSNEMGREEPESFVIIHETPFSLAHARHRNLQVI